MCVCMQTTKELLFTLATALLVIHLLAFQLLYLFTSMSLSLTLATRHTTPPVQFLSRVAETSVYWFQLSSGTPSTKQSSTRLKNLQYPVAVYSTTTNYPNDISVADTIQNVTSFNQLAVSAPSSYIVFGADGNHNLATTLLGFRLDNIMSEQIYFAVQSTTAALLNNDVVVFDRVLLNVGNAWDTVSKTKFTAPYLRQLFHLICAGSIGMVDCRHVVTG
jgi:hypothetical protein